LKSFNRHLKKISEVNSDRLKTFLTKSPHNFVCMWYVIMIQDHRYLESPILDEQRRFRVKCQHPNSQVPHTSHSVQNCVLSPTTSSQ
jgi:hypothetical protein